ncbi:putative DNA/RNA polymerase superfamily [Helianthus annuus]|nr:putative DNA/RNA polymerase superfamily [Helianthus annuus]
MGVFTWKSSDIQGVPRALAGRASVECVKISFACAHKRLSMCPKRKRAMCEQVEELLEANIIREVRYQTWVSNPVMERKKNRSLHTRLDFKDLNRAYPKDAYTLPEIIFKVDSLAPFKFKCFLDAYKGYHQV